MAEVALQSPPSHFPSPSSSPPTPCLIPNDAPHQPHTMGPTFAHQESGQERLQEEGEDGDVECVERKEREGEGDQLSLVALLVAAFRRSLVGCSISGSEDFVGMEIGLPTNVRHVAHVTFDRFNGFLGLPVEFEPEVPRRAPSASATVFGVSTESMQLSYDSRGNSVPTILLMMQRHLYSQGGLQAEGIFRITAGNSQEEYVREQLNRGVIPEGVDAHCLSGLIKAWFRELPTGILDPLPPEEVMQCQTEEECVQLARLLPPTEAALLDWAINLMADVVQMEHLNKMNARNIAMVFAPNMTQMSDPLTALMYAVQVMNFLKTLIIRTLKDREESSVEFVVGSRSEPSDKNEPQSSSQPSKEENEGEVDENECAKEFFQEEPALDNMTQLDQNDPSRERGSNSLLTSIENIPEASWSEVENRFSEVVPPTTSEHRETGAASKNIGALIKAYRSRPAQSNNIYSKKWPAKLNEQMVGRADGPMEKGKGASIMGRINSRTEMFEAWR